MFTKHPTDLHILTVNFMFQTYNLLLDYFYVPCYFPGFFPSVLSVPLALSFSLQKFENL